MVARWIVALAAAGTLVAGARPGLGGTGERPGVVGGAQRERPVLVARPVLEWTAAALGGAAWFTTGVVVKPRIAPEECRWCDSNAFDEEVRSLRWSDRHAADLASDIISYGVAPVSAAGLVAIAAARDGRFAEVAADLPILAEALVASGLVGEAFRLSTGRERPSVHALPAAEKPRTSSPEENNLSFVSGHVATSFALAVSSGTVATMRHRRLAPLVWTVGLGLAAVTSYLRVASDEHYATDVLGGMAIGVGVGLAFPLLHRRRDRGEHVMATVAPAPGGALVVLRWGR
jgi:membrane-associated phospholipid phosphatase